MAESSDPSVQLLALRLQLRKIRVELKLTQKQVASALDWSASKLLRIESGENRVSTTDLKALLAHYKITDPRRVEELSTLAREGRRGPYSGAYDDILSKEAKLLLGYERSASIIRQYEPIIVPGLLQTREYAESMLRLYASRDDSEETLERRVAARLDRQALLESDQPPQMFFILDEAAVRRWIGFETDEKLGSAVMRQQLEHLKKINERPQVSIQIMPFRLGGYKRMRGPFVVIEFPDPTLGDLLYLEDVRGDYLQREDPVDTRPYLEQFWEMEDKATPKEQLNDFLDGVLDDMNSTASSAGALPS